MFDDLRGILYSKWYAHESNKTMICGNWSEDNSDYTLIVPYQLRDSIIKMQNWLCDKMDMWDAAKNEMQTIERFFNK